MKGKKMGGFLTVEASFILPIVMFAIIFLLFISFYLYDLNAVNVIVLDITEHEENERDIKDKLLDELSHRLINTNICKCDVEVESGKILVECIGKFKFPFKMVDIEVKKRIKRIKPAGFIKNVKLFGNVLDGGS